MERTDMLSIERRSNERIFIDTGSELIEIRVNNVRAHRVRLSIGAPEHIRIARGELPEAKRMREKYQ